MCDSLKQDTERDFLNMNDGETQLAEAFMPLFLYETTQNFLDSSDAIPLAMEDQSRGAHCERALDLEHSGQGDRLPSILAEPSKKY